MPKSDSIDSATMAQLYAAAVFCPSEHVSRGTENRQIKHATAVWLLAFTFLTLAENHTPLLYLAHRKSQPTFTKWCSRNRMPLPAGENAPGLPMRHIVLPILDQVACLDSKRGATAKIRPQPRQSNHVPRETSRYPGFHIRPIAVVTRA